LANWPPTVTSGPFQLSFQPWIKPLVTPLMRVRDWRKKLKSHESNLFSS